MADGTSEIETELKLRLSAKHVTRLLASPALRPQAGAMPPRAVRLRSIYFDTPDKALWRKGAALRLRLMRRRWVQTLKQAGTEQAGLHKHSETEQEVPGPSPVLDLLPDALRQTLAGQEESLSPVFESEIRRTIVPLHLGEGQEIEVAIDRGRIKTAEASEPVCEVELEVKQGSASSAFDLALALHDDVPFALEHRTKAERGYALAEHLPLQARMAQAVDLAAETPANQALALAAAEGLRQICANEAIARQGEDIEGVHQMRVGLRRLRVALSLANKARPDPMCATLRGELSWIGGVLGKARDLDVFMAETLAPLQATIGEDRELAELASLVDALRRAAYDELRAALDSPRYTKAQLQIGRWIAELEAPSPDLPDWPALIEVAVPMLRKRRGQIRKFVERHGWQTKTDLHELRLHAKKLRYAAAFYAPLFPRKRTKTFIACLAELQDVLGRAHDGEVVRALLVQLGTRPAVDAAPVPEWRRADSLIEGWNVARAAGLARQIDAAWHALDQAKRFW